VAAEQGFFGRLGLQIELVATRSSDELMTGLVDGTFDVVHAAPDNYISWRDRTGAPIVAWIGGTSGPVALVSTPGIAAVADLRGRDIAVDAVASGFVSVLRRILGEAGLGEGDARLVPVGATNLRYEALRDGRVAATMLTLPWSALAAEAGCVALAEQRDVLPRLQGSCGASLEAWLEANADVADAYLRSIVAALTWAYMPGHEAAIGALIAARYGIEPRHAEAVRVALLDPVTGWPPSAFIDPAGMAEVCRLRADNGQPPASPPSTYYTLGPYGRVMSLGIAAPGWVA